jgi:hypothetical protein
LKLCALITKIESPFLITANMSTYAEEIRKLKAITLVSSAHPTDGMCYLTSYGTNLWIMQANHNTIAVLWGIIKINVILIRVEPAPPVSPKMLRLMKDLALDTSGHGVRITVRAFDTNASYGCFEFTSSNTRTRCHVEFWGTADISLQLDFDATRNTLMNFIAENPDIVEKN